MTGSQERITKNYRAMQSDRIVPLDATWTQSVHEEQNGGKLTFSKVITISSFFRRKQCQVGQFGKLRYSV